MLRHITWGNPVLRTLQLVKGDKRKMVESSSNVMAHGDAWEGRWRVTWRMEWVTSNLHTTSEYGVSSITTAVAYTSTASSQLNWSPRRFKWTRLFRRKTKSGFCACAITFQTQSTFYHPLFSFRFKYVLITTSTSVFQTQFYKMEVSVFLKIITTDKGTVESFSMTLTRS